MSGWLPPGVTDADIDNAAPQEDEYPCRWEKMSGICMICGAEPDEECEVARERRREGEVARQYMELLAE
jgi:hypothetical protein